MNLRNYRLRDYDFKLILFTLALSVIGVFAISSAMGEAGADNVKKQIGGIIVGTVFMIVISLIDYHFILKFWIPIYAFTLVILFFVIFGGETTNNAQRWFRIGGIRFQPSELAKLLLILFFASFIMKYREKIGSLHLLLICVGLFMVPFFLVYKQPDLSTSLVLIFIFGAIIFAGGIKKRIILIMLLIAVPLGAVLISYILNPDNEALEEYQLNRIYGYLYPEDYPNIAYQQNNSITAIGSGMLEGKGYKNNEITSVKNSNFISEAETDFIFAVIGEEFGFRGSAVVIILLFLISLGCLSVGIRASDTAGAIICAGMGTFIGMQGFMNIGVATFLLPNTGIPLPFVSYGLTSLVTLYSGLGVVLNVRLQVKHSVNPLDDFTFGTAYKDL
ncbi:MAG: rod shape-determining protein RodA [Lachnospiraceae bacterium]|nr:rod shape-determining protein RodA [Lachnospiraceae bacterium]